MGWWKGKRKKILYPDGSSRITEKAHPQDPWPQGPKLDQDNREYPLFPKPTSTKRKSIGIYSWERARAWREVSFEAQKYRKMHMVTIEAGGELKGTKAITKSKVSLTPN